MGLGGDEDRAASAVIGYGDVVLRVRGLTRDHLLERDRKGFTDLRGLGSSVKGRKRSPELALSPPLSPRSTTRRELSRQLIGAEGKVEEGQGPDTADPQRLDVRVGEAFRTGGEIRFDLCSGGIAVVTGPSGVGKSTLLRAIAGLIPVDSGGQNIQIDIKQQFEGLVPSVRGGLPAWRSLVRYVAPTLGANLFKESTPKESLEALVCLKWQESNDGDVQAKRRHWWHYYLNLGLARAAREKQERLEKCTARLGDYFQIAGLPLESLSAKWTSFSSGEAQRAVICLALALPKIPLVLLLDEPTSACDPVSTIKIEEFVLWFCDEADCAVVWVSHDTSQVSRLINKGAEHIKLSNTTHQVGHTTEEV
mmetsp:Transcript_13693/g.34476  ORF Transcript_13693/g.34476 Transcript_13693/m.34476 type:complete len:365 (+) Transcript_13693:471-1565(+)